MATLYVASCDCGFTVTTSSQAMADRSLRTHSCEKWREKLAGQARRAGRLAAVDRTPKPCAHVRADHQHGTRACYVLDRCRCLPCSKGNAVAETARERAKVYGRYDKYVSAARSRTHVLHLMDQGMGLKRIVAVSEVSQGLLWKLVYGKRRPDGTQVSTKRVLRTTEDKILAVRVDLAGGALTSGVGATRRIQSLVALGWSQRKLADRLGMEASNLGAITHGRRAEVTVRLDRAVRDLFDELSMQPPPEGEWRDRIAASRARRYATAAGWPPPLAWDEDLIDDPDHQPVLEGRALTHDPELDEAAIYRRLHGDRGVRLSTVDAVELVARCRRDGWTLADIERRTGVRADRYIPDDTEKAGDAA